MRIILTQDVAHLGSLGDEVQVKNGYARNFLLPQGMAISANSKNAAQIAHRRKHLETLRLQAIEAAKAEGEKVAGLELVVEAKAGANGRLFGSVTNRQLQAALAGLGYELDRRSIQLHAPIKNVGNYTATVKLHSEVKTDIAVRVVPIALTEGELAEQAVAEEEATVAAPTEGDQAPEGEAAAEGDAAPEGGPAPVDAAAEETAGDPPETPA